MYLNTHSTRFSCPNCNQTDINKLLYQQDDNTHICTECGVVLSEFSFADYVSCLRELETLEETTPIGDATTLDESRTVPLCGGSGESVVPLPSHLNPTTSKQFKASYKRMVHITERISAHNRREPKIPHYLLDEIRKYHQILRSRNPIYDELARTGRLGKKDIQTLLRFVDSQQGKEYRFFCHLYLERWESIVEEIEGTQREVFREDEMAKVALLMMRFSDIWDQWQPVKDRETKESWKFKDRKHFPNINYGFRQALHLLDLHKYDNAFPVPVTSLPRLHYYWQEMCKALNIEFCVVTPNGYWVRKDTVKSPTKNPVKTKRKQLSLENFYFPCKNKVIRV